MKSFSTDAILLKRVEYGDYDVIVTYFTRSMGRISVMAKNAKKSMKRFAGALDPFIVMNIECTWPRRKNALPILNSLEIENPFTHIRTSAAKTGYASYWLDIINSWMEEGRADNELYDLTCYVLDSLNTGLIPMEVLSLLFQVRFMAISGFTLNITCCGQCGIPLDDIRQQMVTFDLMAGKLVCDRCCPSHTVGQRVEPGNMHENMHENMHGKMPEKTSEKMPGKRVEMVGERIEEFEMAAQRPERNGQMISVSKGTLKQLSWMNTTDIRRADRLKFSFNAVREGENLLEGFIPCHIGRNLKSLMFLKRIRQ